MSSVAWHGQTPEEQEAEEDSFLRPIIEACVYALSRIIAGYLPYM